MKEDYLTGHNISAKSREFADLYIPDDTRRFEYKPSNSALLVIDMQTYFVDEKSHAFIPSAAAIIPGLLRLIDKYRERNRPVFFTRHLNDDPNTGVMDKWWGDLINSDSPLSVIDPRFPANEDEVIEKTQYDAFYNTDLEARLRENGVTQVIICGVMTHLCCESTARAAFIRGYEVFFPVDGTATYNEDFHRATLLNLSHGFAEMVLVEELIGTLGKDSGQ